MTEAVLDRLEYKSHLLAVTFKILDDTIEEFLKSNAHIPLDEGRLVFMSPASLSIYAVSHEIRSLYNQLCATITKTLYATKVFDDCVFSRACEVYKSFSLHKKEAQTVFETVEFHSRRCKFVFVMRTD